MRKNGRSLSSLSMFEYVLCACPTAYVSVYVQCEVQVWFDGVWP